MANLIPMDYPNVWDELLKTSQRWVREEYPALDSQQAAAKALSDCFSRFLLVCSGQEARQTRAAPWAPLAGRRVLELLVMEKYNWTPDTARALNDADMILALHKELSRFKLPDEALDACRPDINAAGLEGFIEHVQSQFFKDDADDVAP